MSQLNQSIQSQAFDASNFDLERTSDFSGFNAFPVEVDSSFDFNTIQIDAEFQSLIPPLSHEERAQLEENLLREGCRDPLVIWKGHNILLDGHNRYELCTIHSISFNLVEVDLPDRESAINWIVDNQLGRRNLTSEAMSYLRGKKYNLKKSAGHGAKSGRHFVTQNEEGENENVTQQDTASSLGAEYKVTRRTIQRDGEYACAIDQIASLVGNEARTQLLQRQKRLTKQATQKLARDAQKHPDAVREAFSKGKTGKDIVKQVREKLAVWGDRSFPFSAGDICWITALQNHELRADNGFWGVVLKVYEEFNYCDFLFWKGVRLGMRAENLKRCDLDETEKEKVRALAHRLNRLTQKEPEGVVIATVQYLSRKSPSELTELEEEYLSIAEKKYGIE